MSAPVPQRLLFVLTVLATLFQNCIFFRLTLNRCTEVVIRIVKVTWLVDATQFFIQMSAKQAVDVLGVFALRVVVDEIVAHVRVMNVNDTS
jgi:hypothetical protein